MSENNIKARDEWQRQYKTTWDTDYETPEQWAEMKIIMLQNEMFIKPTQEELDHLRSLKTENDINRAVQSIINRHWG